MNEQDLIKLKQRIKKTEEELKDAEMRKKYLMEQLYEKYDCSTIAQAEKALAKKQEEKDKLEQEIEEKLDVIEENYPDL